MRGVSLWALASLRPPLRVSLLILTIVTACAQDDFVGPRYRAERELWQINQEFRTLSIKPELVEPETWRALAARYENLAENYGAVHAAAATEPANQDRTDIRSIVARSYVSAARVRAIVGDSLQVLASYERVTADFQDIPLIVAEVALAQGQLAENRRDWEKAAAAYQSILDRVEPQPGEPGAAGVVLELPIRIARLRAQAAAAALGASSPSAEPGVNPALAAAAPGYDAARTRYNTWIQAHPGTRIEMEARLHLANVAADQARWQEALAELEKVEAQVAQMSDPPIEPGGLRLTAAMIQSRSAAPAETVGNTLRSILKDYPKSPAAPRALLALARQAAGVGAVNDAVEYLDRLRDDYPEWDQLAAEGMLLRAHILEQDGRWPDAHSVLRSLPVQHPLTEPALQAPLEIVAHYVRSENQDEAKAALARAEQEYRSFIERYPHGSTTLSARTKLVQTLLMQERFDEAIGELLRISDAMQGNPQAAGYMVEAARVAQQRLGNSERAAEILEQLGSKYPNMPIGDWASGEAKRLREAQSE